MRQVRTFRGPQDLIAALEAYAVSAESPGPPEIARRNAEIERRLEVLQAEAPYLARLIRTYYCSGLCAHARGWEAAARVCGLPHRGRRERKLFDQQVATATDYLWRCSP